MTEQKLNRSISLSMLTLYGLGTVVGAGIYAVIGEVVAKAGIYTPLSFFVASLMAVFSAMSLAELSSRFPRSAGEAYFVRKAFGIGSLSGLVGLLVILSGIVSAATIVNGAVGYVQDFIHLEGVIIIIGLVLLLGLIASLGVRESVGVAAVISIIEIAGVVLVIWSGMGDLGTLTARLEAIPAPDTSIMSAGILGGAVLAFYAFIGFEDMVNMAEEVKNPTRTMPRAILLVLFFSFVLYLLLAIVVVTTMDMEKLQISNAPLADVFEHQSGLSSGIISLIGILAITNGGLVQIIMGARVIYGLTEQSSLPKFLGVINPRTKTPVRATLLICAIVLALALGGSLSGLAELTSLLLLTVFVLVNLALLRLKSQGPSPEGAPDYSSIIPILGAVISSALIVWKIFDVI